MFLRQASMGIQNELYKKSLIFYVRKKSLKNPTIIKIIQTPMNYK